MELNEFTLYLTNKDCSPLTINAYCQDMQLFSIWFEQTNGQKLFPNNVTSMDVREYKQFLLLHKKQRPATINRKLAAIRTYINWALDSKIISYNPITGIKSIEEQKLSPKWLSKKEQSSVLREIERRIMMSNTPTRRFEALRDKSIVILMLNTGIRLGELCSLEIQDIELSERKGYLTIRNGKGMKTRVIPLNSTARNALQEWKKIRPESIVQKLFLGMRGDLKPRAVQEMFQTLGEKTHVHITPHTLRHCFGKNLIDTSQVSLDKVGLLMGHSSLSTTAIYTTPNLNDLDIAVRYLEN